LAADTEAEAARLFTSRELWRLGRERGIYTALPSPEEAAAHEYTEAELLRIRGLRERALYGSAEAVGARLRALAREHEVEEIAILTTLHDPTARRHSYALLAKEFGLTG
jgi:alkanesulfonate monooxygenase SsuD/methylene tetrahydromethanopterin reductase-like flavin-dependent oxidoreductase (luciferase family)